MAVLLKQHSEEPYLLHDAKVSLLLYTLPRQPEFRHFLAHEVRQQVDLVLRERRLDVPGAHHRDAQLGAQSPSHPLPDAVDSVAHERGDRGVLPATSRGA